MRLVFRRSSHNLQSLTTNKCPSSVLQVFGQPLLVWNVGVTSRMTNIDKIMIPNDFPDAIRVVQEKFPKINVEEYSDLEESDTSLNEFKKTSIAGKSNFEIPINSLLRYSKNIPNLFIEKINYPWDFLNVIQKVMHDEIKQTMISKNAKIANSSIIDGPCIIDDNVTIDEFCKIKGPAYIGKGSFIGMGSLVRNSMIGRDTHIGFNCEVSRTYFAGNDKIAHHNVILDSIIGEKVWFGGYSGTANVLLTRQTVKYQIGDKLMNTGTDHFGTVVGNNSSIGASVIILPGRQVPENTIVQAGTIFGKKN